MGLTSRDKRDAYYRLAKAHGYRARAAFKLIQMEDTLSLLKNATRVVDLCAAPGGWTQVVVERCAAAVVADAGEDGPYAQYAVASEAWKALRELWGGAHALLAVEQRRRQRRDAARAPPTPPALNLYSPRRGIRCCLQV